VNLDERRRGPFPYLGWAIEGPFAHDRPLIYVWSATEDEAGHGSAVRTPRQPGKEEDIINESLARAHIDVLGTWHDGQHYF